MVNLEELRTDIENIGYSDQESACLDIISDAITAIFPRSFLTGTGRELFAEYIMLLGTSSCLDALCIAKKGRNNVDSVVLATIGICFNWVKYGKPNYDITNGGDL